jgi:hypothetical protein
MPLRALGANAMIFSIATEPLIYPLSFGALLWAFLFLVGFIKSFDVFLGRFSTGSVGIIRSQFIKSSVDVILGRIGNCVQVHLFQISVIVTFAIGYNLHCSSIVALVARPWKAHVALAGVLTILLKKFHEHSGRAFEGSATARFLFLVGFFKRFDRHSFGNAGHGQNSDQQQNKLHFLILQRPLGNRIL